LLDYDVMKMLTVITTLSMELVMGGCTGVVWSEVTSLQAAERKTLGFQM